jgi:hypothetical protein
VRRERRKEWFGSMKWKVASNDINHKTTKIKQNDKGEIEL